jgi:putative heme-binding domain-containing protein
MFLRVLRALRGYSCFVPMRIAVVLCGLLALANAQSDLTGITREEGAYDAWKLALTPGEATDPKTITVPSGFKVELLRSAQAGEDSWVALAFDPQGRLTVARERKGLLRMTLGESQVEKVEVINDTLLECRGLLYAYDSLYAVANNSKVFCRLRDLDGDDQFEQIDELLRTEGGVGHGRNHVKLGPDGMIYLVHGNNVVAPPNVSPESPLRPIQDDRLIPCSWDTQMFDGDVTLPAGHILRGDPEGKSWTLIAAGLRNPMDVAFNEDGEMFTFDADMEWDVGTPWYRPCRVNHVISGADFGWRRGVSKWPEYFPDCGPTILNIGLASPTAVEFGTRSRFPLNWRGALFMADWAYGRIIAVHLQPQGSSYTGKAEHFVTGKPLNVTDLAFGPDGAMYFVTGGRRTQSGLYRVSFTGDSRREVQRDERAEKARSIRRLLESYHGDPRPDAVTNIWPHLTSDDPSIRHAARIALEFQDSTQWRDLALSGVDPVPLTALMALARSGTKSDQGAILGRLNELVWSRLNPEEQILAARTYQLALIRFGVPEAELAAICAQRLDAIYPSADWRVNHLLCELLAYLKVPGAVEKTFQLLESAKRPEDIVHYLFFLRLMPGEWTSGQRRLYFTKLGHAETLEGARDYLSSLARIRSEALERLTLSQREEVAQWFPDPGGQTANAEAGPPPQFVRDWKLEELLPALNQVGRGRSFESGKQAFAAAQCARCHRVGQTGTFIGPDLTAVSGRFNRRDLLDSMINPSRVVDDKYRYTRFSLVSGAQMIGLPEGEDAATISVRASPLIRQAMVINKAEIKERALTALSPMPPGLLSVLTQEQILDLLAYLESGGDPKRVNFSK